MSVKITGLRELLESLSDKEDDIIKAARKANQAGGKIIAKELKRNVPKSGYSGGNAQSRLIDNIVVSGSRRNKYTGESYVAVGFNRNANFRAHFPEFGSISQSPQGYMTKTVQAVEKDVISEMEKAIRGSLQ